MWKVVDETFTNAERIFPTKQRYVKKMIDACRNDANIKKILAFGSAVTAGCNPWSDIDIYFEMAHDVTNLPVCDAGQAVFDKWTNFSVSEELLAEIKAKGVTVYER